MKHRTVTAWPMVTIMAIYSHLGVATARICHEYAGIAAVGPTIVEN